MNGLEAGTALWDYIPRWLHCQTSWLCDFGLQRESHDSHAVMRDTAAKWLAYSLRIGKNGSNIH